MREISQQQPPQTGIAAEDTTRMPNTDRPGLQPVNAGNRMRFTQETATSRTSPPAYTAHHNHLPKSVPWATSVAVTIKPAGASTSMANAPARAGHVANRTPSLPAPSAATGPALSSTAVTTT